ncbi:hypothetical protein PIIN_11576 [Serendipita indica DSM 11827]|nr:hypothetical protein PIIN_11576 [Serendipita indica DSM 11827]
MLADFRG